MKISFRSKLLVLAATALAVLLVTFAIGVMLGDRNAPPARWARKFGNVVGIHPPAATSPLEEDEHAHKVAADEHGQEEGHEHAGHEHAHSEEASLDLSKEALANLGLTEDTIQPIQEATFVRSVTMPAVIVERPGRTQLPVSTPMTGVITHVDAVTGEATNPGRLLFQLRLTHEDLVTAQKDFLQSLGDLEVEQKEVARLEDASKSGALPGKVLLERQYARDKIMASLASQREALRLHGLSKEQIERIEHERKLLTELRVFVPTIDGHGHQQDDGMQLSERPKIRQTAFTAADAPNAPEVAPPADSTLVIQTLRVHKGETVTTGDVLCVLADYGELYIEGQAFESDATAIAAAKKRGWKATAVVAEGEQEQEIPNLPIAYLANEVDRAARTMSFFVNLKNEIIEDVRSPNGQRFVTWKYRPGQRLQLRVPVEEWPNQLVLPVAAVVKEGPDSFVFQQNGEHFDRIAVHERYRDRSSVVISSDGALFPGDVVALKGAHQMQLALKNKAGGGIDPHAGHNH